MRINIIDKKHARGIRSSWISGLHLLQGLLWYRYRQYQPIHSPTDQLGTGSRVLDLYSRVSQPCASNFTVTAVNTIVYFHVTISCRAESWWKEWTFGSRFLTSLIVNNLQYKQYVSCMIIENSTAVGGLHRKNLGLNPRWGVPEPHYIFIALLTSNCSTGHGALYKIIYTIRV